MFENLASLILSFGSYSPKKLQKLAYYAYSWYLVISDDDLSDISFQAWVHGPVNPDIYQAYKHYGWNEIPIHVTSLSNNSLIYRVCKKVVKLYGPYSADELEAMTHKETPWINARKGVGDYEPSNTELSVNDIKQYFSNHPFFHEFSSLRIM